ncbi:hypothetical protein LguiA_036454 [Lonicera macranthoides]
MELLTLFPLGYCMYTPCALPLFSHHALFLFSIQNGPFGEMREEGGKRGVFL